MEKTNKAFDEFQKEILALRLRLMRSGIESWSEKGTRHIMEKLSPLVELSKKLKD